MEKKRRKTLCRAVTVATAAFVLAGLMDTKLGVSRYIFKSPKIGEGFDGFKIMQISDLHNKSFGMEQHGLLGLVASCKPDMIFLTGDLIDENHPGINAVMHLFRGLAGYPHVFYVSGNHELRRSAGTHSAMLHAAMRKNGIVSLDSSRRSVFGKNGDKINVYGLPYASPDRPPIDSAELNILLYHDSSAFARISALGFDLVFSGHGHGGIVRLPGIGGVLGNDCHFFPEYDAGMFLRGSSTLVSSRGLGGSFIPRFFNAPELVLVTLAKD